MSDAILEDPYASNRGAAWLRGNLHTHSTRSDGRLEIQDVLRSYAARGYQFLMMSDHDTFSNFSGLDPCGLVLIHGNEVSARGPHILNVGARSRVDPVADRQAVIDTINREGGFAILNHPNWEDDFDHVPFALMLELQGYAGIEIVNGASVHSPGSHMAVDKWDRLLSAGRRAWGFSNDDFHEPEDQALGWNVVRPAAAAEEAIVQALRAGSFYASTGVAIEDLGAEDAAIFVRAPEADAIAVVGDHGARLAWHEGSELRFDTSNTFSSYFRVECYGRAGRMAWSQPFFAKSLRERLERLENAARPVLQVLRSDRAPEFTGRLDDALWRQAPWSDQFVLLSTGLEPSVKTEVRAILAPDALYLGTLCNEPNLDRLRVVARDNNHPSIWSDDSMEFFLGVNGTERGYIQIQANAGSACSAMPMGVEATRLPRIAAKATQMPGGWTLELRVPLADLRAETAPGSRWKFHACRNRPQTNANHVWAWVGKSNHNEHRFGWLAF